MPHTIILIALLAALGLSRWIACRIAEATPLDAPKSGDLFWGSVGIAILGLVVGLGEITVPGLVLFWTALWSWRLWPRWSAALPLMLTVLIIGAQAGGHRLYGSPRIVDNRTLLQSPLEVERLEVPNILVLTDGTRLSVAGVKFHPEIATLPPEELRKAMDRRGEPLRFQQDPSQPSGYVAERRIDYFCGNTFFPSFFPHDLPSHTKQDLAVALWWLAVCDRTNEHPDSR